MADTELGVAMQVESATNASPVVSSYTMDQFSDITTQLDRQLSLRDDSSIEQRGEQGNAERNSEGKNEEENEEGEGEGKGEEDDYEFSFVCEAASSPISADDLFDNGQIRPILPWFGNDAVAESRNVGEEEEFLKIPVEKVFVERSYMPPTSSYSEAEDIDRIAEGPYCVWSKKTRSEGESASTVPEACQKSHSTGFSKLWRFRDLLHRSQSDGKDTFVFLTTERRVEEEETTSSLMKRDKKKTSTIEKKNSSRNCKKGVTAVKSKTAPSKAKTTTSSSSYAVQYGKKGENGREKRRSYLPYRQDLVGFFTSANAMSRNVHPY